MFHHIVFYKIKEPKEEIKQEMKRRFLEMPSVISQIKELRVGFDVLATERSCDVSLYVTFDSKEDFFTYKDHPFHVKVAEYIGTIKEASYSVDYTD